MKFLIKKSPDGFIKSVNDEISSILNRNFDSFFPEYIYNEEIDKLAMPVELHEKDKEYTVKAELPGVKKEDLDIDIDKNHITINAKKEEENKEVDTDKGKSHTSILQFPYLLMGAIAMFLHVGTQVIAIDTIIGYANSMKMDLLEAKVFPSYTLTATICGYFLGILLIPKYLSQKRAFQICCIFGLIFSLGVVLSDVDLTLFGHEANLSIWSLVLLGLPNSLIYAGIWPLSIRGLGRFTKIGSSLLVMGLCGNAILPLVYGYFADLFSVKQAYWVLVPCYLYLIFFAVYGYKIEAWSLIKKK